MKPLFILVIFICSFVYSQDAKPIDVVDIAPSSHVIKTSKGYDVTLDIQLSIKKGWHINAHEPLDKYLIATELQLDSTAGYSILSIAYPPSEVVKLQFSDDQLALYMDEAVVKAKLFVPKTYAGKTITVEGRVRYQPCNDQTCLFPVKKPFTATVALKK